MDFNHKDLKIKLCISWSNLLVFTNVSHDFECNDASHVNQDCVNLGGFVASITLHLRV